MASASAPESGQAMPPPAPASIPAAVPPPAATRSAAEEVDLSAGADIREDPGPAAPAASTTTGFLPGAKAERTKVNVAEQHGARTSVIWRFFAKFFPALDDGKNVKCTVKKDDGADCNAVYKHNNEGNTGTGSMIKHLRRSKDKSHQQAAKEFDEESKNSGAAKGARGAALSEAGKGADLFGQASRKPMSKEQTERIHRKYVIWCVVNGRPWKAIDDIGLKLIIAEWDPGFAATTPSFDTLDKVLREMYGTAKTELVEILQSARKDNKKKGYDGPFCSLQLDLTSKANVEYIAASVQLVRPGDKLPTRLSLATRAFPGRHTQIEIKHCIEEMTEDYFGVTVQPKDVFISATVDQGLNVVNACRNLGILTILCRGHRLNSAVMWALGINGTANTGKNPEMKHLTGKSAALVGVSSHSAVNNDALRAIQTAGKEKELEDLLLHADRLVMEAAQQADPAKTPSPLNMIRRNDTRWSSTLAMMKRLVTLMDPINEYLRLHPTMAHRGLSPEEWLILTEVCGVLELMKYVNTAIQGGADGFIGRSIFLCNTLLNLLGDDTIKITDHRIAGASAVQKPVVDLHDTTAKVFDVAITQLNERKVNIPEWEVELVGMFLDPRYKALDEDDCGGGDYKEKLEVALAKLRDSLQDGNVTSAPSPTPAEVEFAAATTPPAKRPAEADADPFAEFSRKREKRVAAAAAVAATTAPCTAASRFEKEVTEYKSLPEVSGSKFDLLSFWDDAARPRLDEDGNIRELAKFPILAMFARVFHSADTTSCQSERDFPALAFCMNDLRLSMRQDRVEMMMFLKQNKGMIPDIRSYTEKLEVMQKVQSGGFDKAVKAQGDGAGEKIVVVVD